jgi:UDP-2,4-diacetamido-2,4,6-trideoxy-beta-L-altropyranose hydrolase
MKVAFRVDASSQIGTGHFMRCLTLADSLQSLGAEIAFVSRHLAESMRNILLERKYEFFLLENNQKDNCNTDVLAHSHWLGVSQQQDAAQTVQVLSGTILDWLVVDHYALDFRWESTLRSISKQILVLDDLADRQHDCDLLLDQNFYIDMADRYSGLIPSHCQLLFGPRYALLRDEFRLLHKQSCTDNVSIKRIFVFFGGVDVDNYTGQAIEALSALQMPGLQVDVVVAKQHPWLPEIEQACSFEGFSLHVQTNRMAELMLEADLAIGAGGATTWERCCLGLPTMAFCLAENQRQQIKDAAHAGLVYSPDITQSPRDTIQTHVLALIENASLRKLIADKGKKLVDGRGVPRLIRKMGFVSLDGKHNSVLLIRQAQADDAAIVWAWRNSEEVRRYFFDPSPVGLNTHIDWWNQSLLDPQRVLLIGTLDGKEMGVVRYDFIEQNQVEVSIYLNPLFMGYGLGECLLRVSQDWLQKNHPEILEVIARVLPKNKASLQAFIAAGFQQQCLVLSRKGC